MYDENVVEQAVDIHTKTYGNRPTAIAYAPGRVEVLGNHADYNEGTVLSAAINLGHCFCISPSDKPGVRLTAGDLLATSEAQIIPGENRAKPVSTTGFDPASAERLPENVQWANYVKGVMFYLRDQDVAIDSVDCTFLGSIPMGAGLGSSAALEVATACAVLEYTGKMLEEIEIGILAQAAENNFVGCNCGLLDQFSSLFGVQHGLLHSDFRSLGTYPVMLPDDVVFLMINPHITRTLADSPYNERRASCELAAVELDSLLDHPVKALRDVTWEELEVNKDKLDPDAARRATHVIGEITRVEQGVKLLAEGGRLVEFGQLLYDSHETSRTAFENSCDELDIVVEAAREAGALGARLSGDGWGGSVVALVYATDADAVCEKIVCICKTKGIEPSARIIIPSAGATVVL